jgi:hypothetical protein
MIVAEAFVVVDVENEITVALVSSLNLLNMEIAHRLQ